MNEGARSNTHLLVSAPLKVKTLILVTLVLLSPDCISQARLRLLGQHYLDCLQICQLSTMSFLQENFAGSESQKEHRIQKPSM